MTEIPARERSKNTNFYIEIFLLGSENNFKFNFSRAIAGLGWPSKSRLQKIIFRLREENL
jgi:hypothetical protein